MDSYQISRDDYCSYYGRWNANDKPVEGVHILMLNEHVARVIEEERKKFSREIANTITNFNEAAGKLLKKLEKISEEVDKKMEKVKEIRSSVKK